VYGYDNFDFRHISRFFGKLTCGDYPFHIFSLSACKIMEDLDSLAEEKLEMCKGLSG